MDDKALTYEELVQENKRLLGLLEGDFKVIEACFTPGEGNIDISHWAVRLIAYSLRKSFDDEGGPNFLALTVNGGEKGPVEVVIRPKFGTKTPCELLAEAKAEIERLKSQQSVDPHDAIMEAERRGNTARSDLLLQRSSNPPFWSGVAALEAEQRGDTARADILLQQSDAPPYWSGRAALQSERRGDTARANALRSRRSC